MSFSHYKKYFSYIIQKILFVFIASRFMPQLTEHRIVIGLLIKSLSPYVLLIYAGRNVKAFIVPISDYKKENKDKGEGR